MDEKTKVERNRITSNPRTAQKRAISKVKRAKLSPKEFGEIICTQQHEYKKKYKKKNRK